MSTMNDNVNDATTNSVNVTVNNSNKRKSMDRQNSAAPDGSASKTSCSNVNQMQNGNHMYSQATLKIIEAIRTEKEQKITELQFVNLKQIKLNKNLIHLKDKIREKEGSMSKNLDVVNVKVELRKLELKGAAVEFSKEVLLDEYTVLNDSIDNIKKEEDKLFASLKKKYAEDARALRNKLEAEQENSSSLYHEMVRNQNELFQTQLKIMLEKMRVAIETGVHQLDGYKKFVAVKKVCCSLYSHVTLLESVLCLCVVPMFNIIRFQVHLVFDQ